MQCEARSQPNQGESEGVYNHTRPSLSPPIWQEIVRNAPPQVIFFTKIKTITIFYKSTYPYSQSERFTFAARRKASHCGAMLHAGKNSRRFTLICGTQINISLLAKRALHFRRKAKSFTLRSNASRREEFPALHVDLRHANQHLSTSLLAKRALHFRLKAKSFTLRSNASRREEFPALHVDFRRILIMLFTAEKG